MRGDTLAGDARTVAAAARLLYVIATGPRGEPPAPTLRGERYSQLKRPGRPAVFDFYRPTDAGPGLLPVVTLVHGGGFFIGSRSMRPVLWLTEQLTRRGFAVLACDYPLVRAGVTLEDQVDAMTEAITVPRRFADRLGVDPQRHALVGFSAGATLAVLAAERAAEGDVSRVVAVFGLYDFLSLEGPLTREFRRRLLGDVGDARARGASPLASGGPRVPVTLLHGESDGLVPCEQSRRFADRRRALGLPVELRTYPDAGHAFFSERGPWVPQALSDLTSALDPKPAL